MHEDILKGKWKQLKGEARKEWGKLSHNDLDVVNGELKILEGKIQEKYGKTVDAKKMIDTFLTKYANKKQ